MTRIRILVMIGSMNGGGSERQCCLLLKHLDRERFEPHLYLGRREGSLLSQIPADVPIHAATDFASVNRLYYPGRVHRQQIEELRGLIRSHRIDVVYDRTFHMSFIAAPACGTLGVPRVSTIVSPPEHAVPLVEKRFVWIKRRRLKSAYHRSDRVIAVSDQAAQSARRYYDLPPDHVEVIRNPVDVAAIDDTLKASGSVAPFAPDSDRCHLVCVGRMTREKGHEDLLRALMLCDPSWPVDSKPLTLHLVGDGPLRSDLQSMWQAYQSGRSPTSVTGHRVVFHGAVDEPAAWIAAADALILPSLFEGLPNVVLEAMAIGTPVIATRAGGTIELQHDREIAFWADPGDPRQLADAIKRFAQSPDRVDEHRRSARDVIDRHHNVRTAVGRIEDLCLRSVNRLKNPRSR